MFKLNTIQVTKNGDKLMPFAVDGDVVSCFTRDSSVVYRKLSDFDFTPPKSDKEVIVVQPVSEKSTDQLFTPEEDNSVEDDYIAPEPEPTEPEPVPTEPEPEPEPTNGGSIWDTVDDDDYI